MAIRNEICVALAMRWSATPGTCLAFNDAIPRLRRHGVDLLSAVEALVEEFEFPDDTRDIVLRVNLSELLVLYFEIADDHDWDSTTFVRGLSDYVVRRAISAVRTVWGTNNDARRTVIPRALFDCLKERLPHDDGLLVTLNRLVKIGQLTFDRSNPGKKAPARFHKPAKRLSAEK